MEKRFDVQSVPDLSGKIIVVTGANSGIGYEAVKVLARKGAEVILAVRNEDKGKAAASAIYREDSRAKLRVMRLDLSDLTSVRKFAASFQEDYGELSILINNAGVMAAPLSYTKDGFELQFGTNHLGHFALTGLLLPMLQRTTASRVVTVSSAAHNIGKIDFDNLDGKKGYRRWAFYGQSKLANLLFAYELNRRLKAEKLSVLSVACHPGFAATNLTAAGVGLNHAWIGKLATVGNLFAQSAQMGALPTLYAAVAPNIHGGEYVGPTGRGGTRSAMRGYPGIISSNDRSRDEKTARELWQVSERLTGVTFEGI